MLCNISSYLFIYFSCLVNYKYVKKSSRKRRKRIILFRFVIRTLELIFLLNLKYDFLLRKYYFVQHKLIQPTREVLRHFCFNDA